MMEDWFSSPWRLGVLAVCSTSMIALGCRSEPAQPAQLAQAPRTLPAPVALVEGTLDGGAPAPSLESLAALSIELAPGMREVERGERALPATIAILPTKANTCVRAVLGAGGAVVGELSSDTGRVLDVSLAAKTAVIGARGPVCLKKGQAAHIDVQGPAAATLRYVVWASP